MLCPCFLLAETEFEDVMQIRNQERRLEEVVPFAEVAKYLTNALSTSAVPAFGRSNSNHPLTAYHGPKIGEEGDISHEDNRECRSSCTAS